jgi:hypothetical protein
LVPGIVARRTDRLFLAVAEPILKIHRHAETTAGLKLAKKAVAAIMVNARKQILHRLVIKLWEV